VISLCGQRQELGKALTLVADMRGRGITPNIHTYTALINTCIRSGDFTLALDVFKTLEVVAPTKLHNSLYLTKGAYNPSHNRQCLFFAITRTLNQMYMRLHELLAC